MLALLGSSCSRGSGDVATPLAPSGPPLIAEGDTLCTELFRVNAEYLAGDDINVDDFVSKGDALMPRFKQLAPPDDDPRWTDALAARLRAVKKASGTDGDLAGAVWQLIGPARAAGLWRCGDPQHAALSRAADATVPASTIPAEDYAKRLDGVIGEFAHRHEEYHHEPDPKEVEQRLIPGNVDSHGPGHLTIQSAMIEAMAALPAPEGSEREAAIFIHFMRQALAAETAGIKAGGTRGEALFEPSYAYTWQAVGVACVTWNMDLCD